MLKVAEGLENLELVEPEAAVKEIIHIEEQAITMDKLIPEAVEAERVSNLRNMTQEAHAIQAMDVMESHQQHNIQLELEVLESL